MVIYILLKYKKEAVEFEKKLIEIYFD